MKKIIILFAMLLIGAGSVSAQLPAYTVKVSWTYQFPYYCQSELSSNYVFVVTLDIYDVVNGVQVTDPNTYQTEDWDETYTLFADTETQIEDWCDQAPKTPSLRVTARVNMVNISTQDVYCWREGIGYSTCYDFSNAGLEIQVTFQ
ncbi:MAG: hypothetical protein RBS55_09445 [Bacteroidales bacterium]|jgi:hypothetical protein|nr:hypothetical protein [Bacteroidales bacterium]